MSTDSTGRTVEGKFAKGNKAFAARDNTYQQRTATLMELAKEVITDAEFKKVLETMLKLAIGGDEKAAQFCQNARFGRLREMIQIEQTTPLFARVEAAMEAIENEPTLFDDPGTNETRHESIQLGPSDDALDRQTELR